MTILGWIASFWSSARARYGKPLFAAFFIAFAVLLASPYTRAQASAKASGVERTPAMVLAELKTIKTVAQGDALEAELLKFGPGAVRPLIELVADHKGQERSMIMLSHLGAKAVPALIDLLPEDRLRPDAAKALAHAVGSSTGGSADRLLDCMAKYSDVNSYCGIAMVRGMNASQSRWIPKLSQALKSSDRSVRLYAALALQQIGLKTPGVREALMAIVSDRDDEVRGVARRLGLKPAPKPVAAKPAAKKGGEPK